METVAKGDMSVSALVRLLEAAGYDLKLVKAGHEHTVEDILVERRSGASRSHGRSGHRGIVQVPLAQFPTAESLLARDSAMLAYIDDAYAPHSRANPLPPVLCLKCLTCRHFLDFGDTFYRHVASSDICTQAPLWERARSRYRLIRPDRSAVC